MPFEIGAYAKLRPYLYHLTAAANLPEIQRSRTLAPASVLMTRAGRTELTELRRPAHVHLTWDSAVTMLRDQEPLHARNMRLEEGWTFTDFVAHLNARVFFWPGDARGPIPHGQRHFVRYADEQPATMRVRTTSVCAANASQRPLFSKYNSGSPRWSGGVASPRGPSTFVNSEQAPFGAGAVVEVSFAEELLMPADAERRMVADGPWGAL